MEPNGSKEGDIQEQQDITAETNFHDMNPEDLDSIEVNEDGTIKEKPAESDDPASDKDITGENDDKSESEAPKDKGTTEEDDIEDPEKDKGDPLKDTQRAFHKKNRELREANTRIKELEKSVREMKAPKEPKQKSPEDLEWLKENDPEQYFKILEDQNTYKTEKEQYDQDVKAADDALKVETEAQATQDTTDSIVDLAAEIAGITGVSGKSYDDQPKEVKEFVQSPEFQKVVDAIEKHPTRYYEPDGSVTQKTLRMVYRDLHFDKLAVNHRQKGREEAVDAIDRAAKGGSKLDRVGKEAPGKGSGQTKSVDKLTQAEIASMGEGEIDSYLADIDL